MDQNWNPMGGFQPQTAHHQHHHQQPATHTTAHYITTPEQDVALARQQMFEAVQHLSASLRNASNNCENFVKTVARLHPSAAATALVSNVGADFLALASGASLGAQTLANHAAAVSNAAAGGLATGTGATPGRKAMTKEEKKLLRKERKANRDPNAPKRPPSAYLLFQNEIREDMRQQFKDLTYSEVLGKISEAWKNLTEEQRKVYQDRTVENMQRWNVEKRQHQSGLAADDTEFTNSGAAVEDQDTQDAAAAEAGHELNGLINVDDATTSAAATGTDDVGGVDEATAAAAVAASNKRKNTSAKGEKKARKN